MSIATGQRVRKEQPIGGWVGFGKSPSNMIRSRFLSTCGFGIGIAESNAFVYG